MANEVHIQRLRGNTARNDAYRGKDGELVINEDSKSIRIHDGVKTGGYGTIDAIHYDTLPDDVPQDLRTGAHVIVGNGRLDGGNVPSTKSSVYAGNTITGGNTGVLVVQERSEGKFYINTTFPEATIAKGTATTAGATGDIEIVQNSVNNYTVNATFPEATIVEGTVKTEGDEGKLEIVKNSTNNFTVNATFPESEVYAAHSDSEDGSEELKELMPDGGIIIERADGAKPVLKQIVDGELVATELSGGVQATYTANADETSSIIDEVEEGALIVEGSGPLNITANIPLSSTQGNTLEMQSDGMYNPRSAVITANAGETASVLPNLAEGALIIEGPGDVVVTTEARVSEDEDNIITRMADGIAVNGKQLLQSVFDALYPVGSYVFGTKPAIGTWTKVGESKVLSNSDDQYIVAEAGVYTIGDIAPGTSKNYTIAPTKTGYDCIGVIPSFGGGTYYSTCAPLVNFGGSATARTCTVSYWNNSDTLTAKNMYAGWTAIFRSKYGTEIVTKWKRTA